MQKGTYLLVVDSAGSFSETKIGEKTYKFFNLLDRIDSFKILESFDSVWYRYPSHLSSSLKLDNIRYCVRLYQKK